MNAQQQLAVAAAAASAAAAEISTYISGLLSYCCR